MTSNKVEMPKIDIPTSETGKPKKPLGIVWYESEKDFLKMQDKCPDFTTETYDVWKDAATEALSGEGTPRVRVPFNPEIFFMWCDANKIQTRYEARQKFVHDLVEDSFKNSLKLWKKKKKK